MDDFESSILFHSSEYPSSFSISSLCLKNSSYSSFDSGI